jgi:SPP1 family phage portal protein
MTNEQLNKVCEKIEAKESWYSERTAYAKGFNPVVFQPLPKPAPDYRIAVPVIKKAMSFYSGYFMKSGAITYEGDYYDTTLQPIFDENDEQLVSSLEFQDALKFGHTYELLWVDNNGKEKNFYPIPAEQGMPVYSDDLRKKLIGFYWLREIEEDEKEVYVLTYWDDKTQMEWRKKEGDKNWVQSPDVPHAFGEVPVNIGQIAEDGSNLFDHVKDLLDLYDVLISGDIANESQRYANALILFAERLDTITTDESGRTMVDRLKEINALDGLGDDPAKKVQYLVRNIPTDFIKFACETIMAMITDLLPLPNMESDKVGGTLTGVAQAYRLLPFEFKVADIEANWSRFLQNRIYLLSAVTKGLGGSDDGSRDVTIKFTRNLPRNLSEIADIVSKLVGVVSEETLLRLFPADIIPDVKEEMKRIKAEKPEETMPVTEPVDDAV